MKPEKKRKYRKLKVAIIVAIALLLLAWLLNELAIYRHNMMVIENYIQLSNSQIHSLQTDISTLQHATRDVVVKINGIQSHMVSQDNIIKELAQSKQQLQELERNLSSLTNNIPQIDVEKPNTSLITDVGNAAGIFTVVVGGLEILRRAIMFLPLIP